MKNKLPEKLTMQIIDNKITNLDVIIETINLEENYDLLKEYYSFLMQHSSIADFNDINTILVSLNQRLIFLEQKTNEFLTLLDNIKNIYVSEEEAIKLLSKYVNNEILDENETMKIYAYLSNQIAMFEYGYEESLTNEEKDILNYTMDYMKKTEINAIKSHLINRYNEACIKEINEMGKSNGKTKKLLNPDTPLSLSDEGISLSIIIITVTILLGAIIAAILLVK